MILVVKDSRSHLPGVHNVRHASSSTDAQANAEYLFNKGEGLCFISSTIKSPMCCFKLNSHCSENSANKSL